MLTIKISNPIRNKEKIVILPAEEEMLYQIMEDFGDYIVDVQSCELGHISLPKYIDLDYLNELVKSILDLPDYEQNELKAILEAAYNNLDDALITLDEKNYQFYPDMNMIDVAEYLVDEGLFGEIPESIIPYIDYDAIARDLSYSGYVQTDYGVIELD